MEKSAEILSDITVFNKYAKYNNQYKSRELLPDIILRNTAMHVKKFPHMEDDIYWAFGYVLDKKVLPSMRAFQFAGNAAELNPARLYNCFGKETEFISSNGVVKFSDCYDGETLEVPTHTGEWKPATVRNYGKQKLNTLVFKRGRSEKRVRATKDHTWILKDGSRTTSIKIGDCLGFTPILAPEYCDMSIDEKIMWAYGFVYGDGTCIKNNKGEYHHSMVRLCGSKVKFLERFEELGFKNSTPKSFGADVMVYTGTYLKTKPEFGEVSIEMLRAFIRGYLDADGALQSDTETASQFKSVQTSHNTDIEWLRSALEMSGFFINGVDDYTGQVTNLAIRKETKRFRGYTHVGVSPASGWYLREIIEDEEDDVWCLEVEDNHSFILSGGLLTGNCSYAAIDHIRAFSEAMFLLLSGCGFGYSVQKHHIEKLPEIIGPNTTKHKRFLVSDDIEGWADAIKALIDSYFKGKTQLIFDDRGIRPKGTRLVTSGGKAPGPQPLKDCIHNIKKVLDNALSERGTHTKLLPIEAHDIICHIANAVMAGGIRRAACIALFSFDDDDMLNCKSGAWWELNPQRGRANNSVVLDRRKVQEENFYHIWERVKASGSGEPGIVFSNDPHNYGVNPCAEISLKSCSFCNLTTVNVSDVESQEEFESRIRAATIIGTIQASYTDFHYLRDVWRRNAESEALLGVSMTGIASNKIFDLDIKKAAKYAVEVNKEIAKKIGINPAKRVTTVKPEGTASLVLGCSSGVHAYHSPYYIRRMRLNKDDALYKYILNKMPELIEDEFFDPVHTAVLSVPIKSPDGAIIRTESPIDLLSRVKTLNKTWIKGGHISGANMHNVSVTVSINDNEWDIVGSWMWENKEYYNGISVLPIDYGSYKQVPFQECSEETYNEMFNYLKDINLKDVIEEIEEVNIDHKQDTACGGGGCEIT